MSEQAGKSPNYIKDLKRSGSEPSEAAVKIWGEILGTTPDYLFGKTDKKNKPTQELSELSPDDMELLDAFRKAPPEKRKAILDLLK